MSLSDRFDINREQLKLLIESLQVIIEKFNTATDLLTKLIAFDNEPLESSEDAETIQTLLDLLSNIESKKLVLEALINLGLVRRQVNELEIPKGARTELNNEELTHLLKAPEENVKPITAAGNENKKNQTALRSKQYSLLVDDPLTVSSDKAQQIEKQTIEFKQDVIPTKIHFNQLKHNEKEFLERDISMKETLKICNLSEEKKRKLLRKHKFVKNEGNFESLNSEKRPFKHDAPLSFSINFLLQNGQQAKETDIYRTYFAIFRNLSVTGISPPRLTHAQNDVQRNNNNLVGDMNNSSDIMMMPCDIKGNSNELEELRHFLSLSTNNSYSVQIPEDFNLDSGKIQLVVDVAVNKPSRKPQHRQFIFRMHVVTSEMFEMALHVCQIESLELTYTNIFPSDCRMFIALPIYRDGYFHRKDVIYRE